MLYTKEVLMQYAISEARILRLNVTWLGSY
jgi:hypothetical protein